MKEVSVNFKNCFGIKKLEHTFSFENKDGRKVFAIYARNGLMKTSFAKTCQKISQGKKGEREIKDVIFNNKGTADIKIDGKAIKKDQLFVIRSFQESYESDVSSLLLDSEIKEELTNLMALKDKFLEFLEEKSGLKRKKTKSGKPIHELLENIKSDFAEESILQTIPKFKEGINSKKYDFISNPDRKYSDIKYSDIKYSDIFDETTLKKIKSDEFQKEIDNFIKSSKKIYEEFGFLEKGKFTYPKLLQIQTSLEQNNFFIKGNIIELAGKKITSEEALEKQINKIKDKIKEMPEYKKIEDLLEDAKGRKLKDALELYPEIIEYLSKDKLKKLKKALWIRYCKEYEDFKKLCDEYEKFNKKI